MVSAFDLAQWLSVMLAAALLIIGVQAVAIVYLVGSVANWRDHIHTYTATLEEQAAA